MYYKYSLNRIQLKINVVRLVYLKITEGREVNCRYECDAAGTSLC